MSLPTAPDSPTLEETLRIMDVASAMRREKDLVEQEFDTEKSRAILREKLLNSAEVVGERLTPEQIDAAIDWYYRNLYRFKEPPPSWELSLAHIYIHRWRWGSLVAALLLAGAGLWWLLYAASSPFSSEAHLRRQVATISQQIDGDAAKIREAGPNAAAQSELEKLTAEVASAKSQRNVAELQQLSRSMTLLEERVLAERQLQDRITATRATIDRHTASIRSLAKDPEVTAELDQTLAAVEAAQKRSDAGELQRLDQSVSALDARLRSEAERKQRAEATGKSIDQYAASIRAISKDDRAKEQLATWLASVEAEKSNRNADELQRLAKSLADLDQRLKEDYAVTVVARPGEKSAVDRYYTDDQGKRVSGYYLIVEAHDAEGNVLPRRIRNSESDQYETVSRWAERVPQSVYERLKQDKISDGVLNETAFAVKRRGELDEEMVMKDSTGTTLKHEAQITRW